MPFTGSHPAAVLPFFRPLVPSALVIGSMVPDLGYYVPLPVSSGYMHTLPGILGVDLLCGVLCFVVWQVLVTPVLVAAAPEALRRRLAPDLPVSWRSYLRRRTAALTLLSVWVGAATHMGWDEFTHPRRFGTAHIAWLAQPHGPLPGYQWAQYASGVAGGLILIGAAVGWWGTATRSDEQRVPAAGFSSSLMIGCLVVLSTIAGAVYAASYGVVESQGVRHTLFLVATWGGGAGLAALLLTCLAIRRRVSAP